MTHDWIFPLKLKGESATETCHQMNVDILDTYYHGSNYLIEKFAFGVPTHYFVISQVVI